MVRTGQVGETPPPRRFYEAEGKLPRPKVVKTFGVMMDLAVKVAALPSPLMEKRGHKSHTLLADVKAKEAVCF